MAAMTEAPEAAARAAAALIARVTDGNDQPEVAATVGCLPAALAELDYDTRRTLYAAAVTSGDPTFARLVLAAAPPTATPTELDRAMRAERPLRAMFRRGFRTSSARRSNMSPGRSASPLS